MPNRTSGLRGVAFLVLAASAVVVILATASTSSARFAAQTSNANNLWEAAHLDLDVESTGQLFLDGEGLYPELVLENCIIITYKGTVDGVDIRLHTPEATGSLAPLFNLGIEIGSGTATDCSDFQSSGQAAFTGTVRSLAAEHGSFGTGLLLASDVDDGQRLTLRASGSVADTNRAQGLGSRFVVFVEARP